MAGVIAEESRAGARAFLHRLLRLDRGAVVRLRPVGGPVVAMWARLPFGVLVTRGLRADAGTDRTVRASELSTALDAGGPLPDPVDSEWRWQLPPGPGTVVERLPADEIRRVAHAAASAVRTALDAGVAGRVVGERRIRDAMLNHVPIVVRVDSPATVDNAAGQALTAPMSGVGAELVPAGIPVPQRLVQGLITMGFVGTGSVSVRRVGRWTGLAAEHGASWYRDAGDTLTLQISPYRPNG